MDTGHIYIVVNFALVLDNERLSNYVSRRLQTQCLRPRGLDDKFWGALTFWQLECLTVTAATTWKLRHSGQHVSSCVGRATSRS